MNSKPSIKVGLTALMPYQVHCRSSFLLFMSTPTTSAVLFEIQISLVMRAQREYSYSALRLPCALVREFDKGYA